MLRDAGMTVTGGTLLFRLAETSKAQDIFRRLGEAGILVRSFEHGPGWLRFGIPSGEEEWRRLAEAFTL
jgi:cobalamin biosynthetic protein CobC